MDKEMKLRIFTVREFEWEILRQNLSWPLIVDRGKPRPRTL